LVVPAEVECFGQSEDLLQSPTPQNAAGSRPCATLRKVADLKPDAWETGFRAGTEGRNPPMPEGFDVSEFQLGAKEGNAARPAMFRMLKELTPEERATLKDPTSSRTTKLT
jgi:hypothetical protein